MAFPETDDFNPHSHLKFLRSILILFYHHVLYSLLSLALKLCIHYSAHFIFLDFIMQMTFSEL